MGEGQPSAPKERGPTFAAPRPAGQSHRQRRETAPPGCHWRRCREPPGNPCSSGPTCCRRRSLQHPFVLCEISRDVHEGAATAGVDRHRGERTRWFSGQTPTYQSIINLLVREGSRAASIVSTERNNGYEQGGTTNVHKLYRTQVAAGRHSSPSTITITQHTSFNAKALQKTRRTHEHHDKQAEPTHQNNLLVVPLLSGKHEEPERRPVRILRPPSWTAPSPWPSPRPR